MIFFRKRFLLGLLLSFFIGLSTFAQAPIKMVSGIKGEIYDQFAKDIQNNTHVNLKIYQSRGSLDNLDYLFSDSIQIAFVQYDVLQTAHPKKNVSKYIKVFLPLYHEEVHLIALRNSGISSLGDLAAKSVGVGHANSGTHVYVGAAPSGYLSSLDADVAKRLKLVDIQNKRLSEIYEKQEIKKETYSWNNTDIYTINVPTLLLVNTHNIDTAMARQIDILYNDLNDNLKGIQWNKFSHPKWAQVDFSNLNGIDWPVYKKEYVSYELVVNIMAIIAALLSFIQIYFIINKLWKRKHEQVVAESISISAMFISIFINGFFAIKNMGGGNIPQLSANLMWITASVISTIIGVGLYVSSKRDRGFFHLLLEALNLERREAGDLAKVFFKPSGAAKIIEILGRVAMVDNDLDEKERDFIQGFADNWGIKMDWDGIQKYLDESEQRFQELRRAMNSYLDTSPPNEQASQLMDVISLLVNVDGVLTEEEDLMLSELTGLIMKYLGKGSDVDIFKVAVVPQSEEQEKAVLDLLKDLNKEEIAGGWAFVSEAYYSERYAGIISAQYRALKVFSVVFKPNEIEKLERYVKEKHSK